MRTLLNLAHCHGAVLGTSWQLVLATLQVVKHPFCTSFSLASSLIDFICSHTAGVRTLEQILLHLFILYQNSKNIFSIA